MLGNTPMNEKEVRNPVIKYFSRVHPTGLRKRNTYMRGTAVGFPDDVFYFPNGNILHIEFKGPGKKPSVHQAKIIAKLRDIKQLVCIVDDPDWGAEALDIASRWKGRYNSVLFEERVCKALGKKNDKRVEKCKGIK